jgi:phage-related protein
MIEYQPELQDGFGCRFHGEAKTTTGDIWWYEVDGVRYPLWPVDVRLTGSVVSASP